MNSDKTTNYPPLVISATGRRKGNEDTVFPPQGETENYAHSVFLVCDGVGGEARGEVASQLTAKTIGSRLNALEKPTEADIREAIEEAETMISRHIEDNPMAKGMATTLTLLSLDGAGALLAHLGDSRIYLFRDGRIIHRTEDHSLVQELINGGLISPEQALHHPRRNVVTKVVMAAPNPAAATIERISSLAEEDVFFLCSDGVLECFSDEELSELMQPDNGLSDQERMDRIEAECSEAANDNYSACLVRLASVPADTSIGVSARIGQFVADLFSNLKA